MRRSLVHMAGAIAVMALGAAPASAQDWADDLADAIERQADLIASQVERQADLIASQVERQVEHLERHLEQMLEGRISIAVQTGVARAQRQAGDAARRAAQAARDAERRRRQEARRGPEATERISRTLRLGRNGTVDLQNLSGDIVITGGGGSDVRIEAIKRVRRPNAAEARSLLEGIEVRIQERNGNVEIRTNYPRRNWTGGVDYTLTVPRDANLVLRSVSGDVRVDQVNGELRAETISGDLRATAVRRIRQAKTVSGDLEVTSSDGDELAASTVSGAIVARGVKARTVDLQSVSGDLRLDDVESERTFVRSVSGDVDFTGRLSRQGRYEFQSHSGDVRVAPIGSAGFAIEASTFSGNLRSDFPLTLQGDTQTGFPRRNNRAIRGSFGEGGALITLQSFSGDITIVKR